MRLRHIRGCEVFVADSPDVVTDPEHYRGKWKERFGNDHPVELEIGMGKGRFLRELSGRHPEISYIGLERYESVLMKAIQRKDRENADLPEDKRKKNLLFICDDAERLPEFFEPGEISKIYLNFSDPWPKASHAKRRLTSSKFLALYDRVLAADGTVEFKTDNTGLFEWSVENIPGTGWKIIYETHDLHAQPDAGNNVMTEYEEKFSGKGQKICKLILRRETWS